MRQTAIRPRRRNRSFPFAALGLTLLLVAAGFLVTMPVKSARAQATQQIPEPAVYWNIFHHVAWLEHKAATAEAEGRDGTSIRRIVPKKIGLNDAQGEALRSVALQCEADVAVTDQKASAIVRKMRSLFVAGRIPQGYALPPVPDELKQLQAERNQTILRCRDTLRGLVGEQAFSTLDDFAHTIAARTPPRVVKPVTATK